MFRVIGGAVVYGLALYGVVKLFDRPDMEVVIQAGDKPDNTKRNDAAVDVAIGQNDKSPPSPASELSSRDSAPPDSA